MDIQRGSLLTLLHKSEQMRWKISQKRRRNEMGILQKIYDSIKSFKAPTWLKNILQEIQNILVQVMLQVGKEYISKIQDKIIEVSKYDINNKEKFRAVFDFTKALTPTLKDSAINLLLETLVSKLKKDEVI